MAAKDSKTAPETIRVRLGNGHTTSAGAGVPGDVVDLPPDEALALISAGYATRVR
jgi:hypothetical protein